MLAGDSNSSLCEVRACITSFLDLYFVLSSLCHTIHTIHSIFFDGRNLPFSMLTKQALVTELGRFVKK